MAQPPSPQKRQLTNDIFSKTWELTPGPTFMDRSPPKNINNILFQKAWELTPGPFSMADPPPPPVKIKLIIFQKQWS